MRVKYVIARIVNEGSRESRQSRVQVLRRYKVGDQHVRQSGLREAVTQQESLRSAFVQRPLQLPGNLRQSRIKNRVFFVDLGARRVVGTPVRPTEMRI